MTRTPSAVWIVDTNKEHLAVEEARKLRIPIIGILDSNCDPDVVDYPIPGNDDAIRAVGLLTRVVADAVADGLIARSGAKTGDGDAAGIGSEEPLAEWERELLQGDAEQAAVQAAGGEAPATAVASAAEGPVSAAEEAAAPEGPIVVPEGSPADAPAAEVTGATTEPADNAAADSPATDDGNA
jgi:small subunit ribosomal protein S2